MALFSGCAGHQRELDVLASKNPALNDFINIFNSEFKGKNIRYFAAAFLGEYLDKDSSLSAEHLPFYLNCNLEISVKDGIVKQLNLQEKDIGNCTVPYRLIKYYQSWKKNYPDTAQLHLNELSDYSYGLLSYEEIANLVTECTQGNKNACYNAGFGYLWHQDADEAVNSFSKACSLSDEYSCNSLGTIYQDKENFKTANRYYEKSCTLGLAEGCFNQASLLYLKDYGKKLIADYPKAAALYRRSCDLGFDYGCLNLGYMYSNGHGVDKDQKKAFEIYDRLCQKDNAIACGNLGKAYINGEGITINKAYGLTLERRACEGGDASACIDLGGFSLQKSRTDEALYFYERACELGSQEGCQLFLKENR